MRLLSILLLLLFYSFILSFLHPVSASCNNSREPVADLCADKRVDCSMVYINDTVCCDQISDCPSYVPPTTTPPPPPRCLNGELQTAIGCVSVNDPGKFIAWLLGVCVGLAGGIAFLLMLFGSFKIMVSAGDPKAVAAGKETITSALSGLLFIIFSVFLLYLIGTQILNLPGLT